jgi:hypothetical protein
MKANVGYSARDEMLRILDRTLIGAALLLGLLLLGAQLVHAAEVIPEVQTSTAYLL